MQNIEQKINRFLKRAWIVAAVSMCLIPLSGLYFYNHGILGDNPNLIYMMQIVCAAEVIISVFVAVKGCDMLFADIDKGDKAMIIKKYKTACLMRFIVPMSAFAVNLFFFITDNLLNSEYLALIALMAFIYAYPSKKHIVRLYEE
ncbi:MAG: hypothetical protein IJA46_00085 [Bacteroidaceae bacterium]|nr:hypothetical protein [Bacteroidaceae bacterium]